MLLERDPRNRDVLFPYLSGEDLNSRPDQSPSRWVINFHDWPLEKAETYPACMAIVRERVKPERDRLSSGDASAKDRAARWWQFSRPTIKLYEITGKMSRVLFHPFTSKYLCFAFAPTGIVYAGPHVVVTLSDYADFAYLQSCAHEAWALQYSSTMKRDLRYAPSDCFETFPFPLDISDLDDIGERYYAHRQGIMLSRQEGLTKTYNRFHNRSESAEDIERLRELHVEMDRAVAEAYGWGDLDLGHGFHETKQGVRFTISEEARREVLDRLLLLNHERYAEEVKQGLHDKKAKKGKAKKRTKPKADGGTSLFSDFGDGA